MGKPNVRGDKSGQFLHHKSTRTSLESNLALNGQRLASNHLIHGVTYGGDESL
jgi:hypothetical protein